MKPHTKNVLAAAFKLAAIATLFTAIATLDVPQQKEAPKAPVPAAAQR